MRRARRLLFAFVSWLTLPLAACGSGTGRSPEATLEAFRAAVERGRYDAAYDMMSQSYQRRVSREEFARYLRDHPSATEFLVRSLRSPDETAIAARVSLDEGDVVLVAEDGAFRIAGNVVDFYDQSTPRNAIRSFVRAVEHRRYDVVLRFVPNAEREGMSEAKIAEAWGGDQREEVERTIQNLRASLDRPIEVVGDRATMPYGERFTCQLVREDGVWRIESPE